MPDTRYVYCPTCRRNVRVLTTRAPSVSDGHAPVPDPENLCMDFGAECVGPARPGASGSGVRCPVFGTHPLVMGVARARSGIEEDQRATVPLQCDACGQVTSQEPVGASSAVCRVCGTVNRLDREEG
jgi:hypothetical protein